MDFDSWMLREVFESMMKEVTGWLKNSVMRSFMVCNPYEILFG
jgi:hypothetical protein